jgi:hypothetical protein
MEISANGLRRRAWRTPPTVRANQLAAVDLKEY